MEKFSQWRDKGTGIAPFLPHPSSTFSSSESFVLLKILNVLLAVVSCVLKLVVLIPYTLIHITFIVPVFGQTKFRQVSLKVILLVVGLWFWNIVVDGTRVSFWRLTNGLAVQKKQSPRHGDIILSNFVSPIDPLIYSALFDPIFAVPDSDGYIKVMSLFKVSLLAMKLPETSLDKPGSISFIDLQRLATKSHKVIVLFCEGTTTNGRAMLSPNIKDNLSTRELAIAGARVFPASVKYLPQDITTPLPPRSSIHYILRITSRWKAWNVRLHMGPAMSTDIEDLITACTDGICRLGRIKKVELNVKCKSDFAKAWKKNR
ncbi:hypothetical protein V1512DRAFT_257677 [Lipomyces arxii]|uniref:uncharacterized protein n=1 Tax=Lipomyces arxii TaxID=56418 RepID=UPI0034CED0CB